MQQHCGNGLKGSPFPVLGGRTAGKDGIRVPLPVTSTPPSDSRDSTRVCPSRCTQYLTATLWRVSVEPVRLGHARLTLNTVLCCWNMGMMPEPSRWRFYLDPHPAAAGITSAAVDVVVKNKGRRPPSPPPPGTKFSAPGSVQPGVGSSAATMSRAGFRGPLPFCCRAAPSTGPGPG